jgi:hypothetical protein
MSEANTLGYPGTWKAILSTSTTNARDRLTIQYPVVLASNGATIASSNLWNTLTGSIGGYPYIWTGTNGDGTVASGYTCNDWTSASSSNNGYAGRADSGNEAVWLDWSYFYCNYNYNVPHLYCVNQ